MTRIAPLACCAVLLTHAGARAQEPARDWREGGVCYEVFVRSFHDSDGDGIGDLNGLIRKLDYINDGSAGTRQDLGAGCIWLMPISPSPSYHGYDVTDYYRVDPEYGTNEDFRRLVDEAHRRDIRVLIDLVLNHSSSEHPFFKHALLHPDSPYRDWYLWSPRPRPRNAWGGENWHRSPVREEWYYGFFWQGMPDLNVENPEVVAEAKRIATYWLTDMGADGFRLDAIRHLVEEGERTENVEGTHAFLRDYSAHVRAVAPDAFTIGEVYDSIGAMLPYYPDQLDAHFAFEVADSILSAVNNQSARGLLAPVLRLQQELPAERWAPFLRNHDQTRTITALGGDTERARAAATILLTLPGVPFVYYGEEIGMSGDKPDPRLRTPMHWERARAAGFTTGVPWEPLQPDSMTANVAVMDADPRSLLNHYRELIHLRAASAALGSGELLPVRASHDAVAAYLRRADDDIVLVVVNLADTPLEDVALSLPAGALPAGEYRPVLLTGDGAAASLRVRAQQAIDRYVPLRRLAPTTGYILRVSGG